MRGVSFMLRVVEYYGVPGPATLAAPGSGGPRSGAESEPRFGPKSAVKTEQTRPTVPPGKNGHCGGAP
jgi:hypothetical protein